MCAYVVMVALYYLPIFVSQIYTKAEAFGSSVRKSFGLIVIYILRTD